MYRLLLLLAPAVLLAGAARYARVGDMDGKVEVQLHAATLVPRGAELTLTENAWLRTGASSRLEIELDEGSALRLGPDSLVELSDYARLSTGQRVTWSRWITAWHGSPVSPPDSIRYRWRCPVRR